MSYAYNIRNIFTGPVGQAKQDVAQMLEQSCWACRANPNSHRCECNREPAAKPVAEPVNRYPSPEETPPASDMRKRLVWMTNCSKEMAGFYREAIAELRITHLMFMGSDLGIKARASAPSQRQFVGTEAFWLQGPQGEVLNYSDCVYLHPTINSDDRRKLSQEVYARARQLQTQAKAHISKYAECKHGHEHYCGFCGAIGNY